MSPVRPPRPLVRLLTLTACLPALLACNPSREAQESAAGPDAVAEIRGHPVTVAQFEAYVAGVTPAAADQPPEPNQAELWSRLFDAFVDEELIVHEAAREGIEVTEREVTESLRRLQRPEAAEGAPAPAEIGASVQAPTGEAARERMRRSLLMRKFRQEKILKGLDVTPDEIRSWYEEHKDEFNQPARVILRQILLDDEAAAKQMREELVKNPDGFDAVAKEKSMAPDGGRPRAYEESELQPGIVTAAAAVPDGGITEVVTDSMGSRIFKIEKRQPSRMIGLTEAADRIHVSLMQEKGKRRYDEYMETLRRESGLVLHDDRLPFSYKKRSP